MVNLMNTGGIAATNCFVIADEAAGQAVLFDAPDHTVTPLLDQVQQRGWDLIGLWLTHGHFDHVADHAVVSQRFPGAKVLIHPLDEGKLRNPVSRLLDLPFDIPPRQSDGPVEDGQVLRIGNLDVHVIHTPGHAPGHVMYHLPNEQVLVGGDLIIMGAVGRTDFPDSNHAHLERSIRRVMALPGNTHLLPGHGQPSTLNQERQTNSFVNEALEGD